MGERISDSSQSIIHIFLICYRYVIWVYKGCNITRCNLVHSIHTFRLHSCSKTVNLRAVLLKLWTGQGKISSRFGRLLYKDPKNLLSIHSSENSNLLATRQDVWFYLLWRLQNGWGIFSDKGYDRYILYWSNISAFKTALNCRQSLKEMIDL